MGIFFSYDLGKAHLPKTEKTRKLTAVGAKLRGIAAPQRKRRNCPPPGHNALTMTQPVGQSCLGQVD